MNGIRRSRLLTVAFLVAVQAGACSDDAERVCEPGAVQRCPCLGGSEGVQTCADDGARWGICDCGGADADADADADAGGDGEVIDDAGCEASCGPADARTCFGEDLQECRPGADGCLAWSAIQRCSDTGLSCREVGGVWGCHGPDGNCSLDGAPCFEDVDCPEASVEGFCMWDPWGGPRFCGYDTRVDTAVTGSCLGNPVHYCASSWDCAAGLQCNPYDSLYCGVETTGVCADPGRIPPSCPDDSSSCRLTGVQTCVICGDGEVDDSLEECDDGNSAPGDGCSATCRYERHCVNMYGVTHCGCYDLDDCLTTCDECGTLHCTSCS